MLRSLQRKVHMSFWVARMALIVFDVQLSIWWPGNCITDGVRNALLISHFIKFNLLFFFFIYLKNEKMVEIELFWIAWRINITRMKPSSLKSTKIHLKPKCQCPLKMSELLVMPPFDFLVKLEHQRPLERRKLLLLSLFFLSCAVPIPFKAPQLFSL